MTEYEKTPRTTLKRAHKRGQYDRKTVHAIIDEALVCHVAVSTASGIMNIPSSHWRIDDTLYIHGAAKGASILALEQGNDACIAISLLDGAVFARSVFSHSVNFRSVLIYAQGRAVEDPEKINILKAFIEKYAQGRWDKVRPPAPQELKATKIIAFDLKEVSAKIRSAPPDDSDLEWDVWAGVVPLALTRQNEQECQHSKISHPVSDGLLPHINKRENK